MTAEPHDPFKVNSVVLTPAANPIHGVVRWSPVRSLWNGAIMAGALILGPLFFSWGGVAVFLATSAVVLCAGHSVGYHRRLIHRSFKCSKAVERTLVWFGAAVGMGGPLWTIRIHDLRDWAQRQPECHDFLRHGRGVLGDGWWNLHCRLELQDPPGFDPGPEISSDPFYRFLERTWMLHQLPIAGLLFLAGGWSFVAWGVFVRIFACNTMHWYVGRLCHSEGPQSWLVDEAGVQAHDLPWAAIPTMGESWHNNHHAFPGSARHGLYPGQIDVGFGFIWLLGRLGLAWDIQTPDVLPARAGISPVTPRALSVASRDQAQAQATP